MSLSICSWSTCISFAFTFTSLLLSCVSIFLFVSRCLSEFTCVGIFLACILMSCISRILTPDLLRRFYFSFSFIYLSVCQTFLLFISLTHPTLPLICLYLLIYFFLYFDSPPNLFQYVLCPSMSYLCPRVHHRSPVIIPV